MADGPQSPDIRRLPPTKVKSHGDGGIVDMENMRIRRPLEAYGEGKVIRLERQGKIANSPSRRGR